MGQALEGFYTKRYGLDKHSTAKRMLSALGSDIFNNYYRFAFVRNPFTRTISTFKFLKNWLPQSSVCKDAAIFEKFETVDDMIASEYWQNTAGVAEIFCPQVRQLCT